MPLSNKFFLQSLLVKKW